MTLELLAENKLLREKVEKYEKAIEDIKTEILSTIDYEQGDDLFDYVIDVDSLFFIIDKHIGKRV